MEQKKIRIAHVAGALTAGGVEAVIYNYFSHMDRERYELYYITYNPADEDMKQKFENIGFHIFQVPQKRKHPFRSCVEVYRILRKNRIQIVHSHMTLMCFVTNVLGRMAGAKVLIAHSHLALVDQGISGVFHWLCKILTRVTATHYFACGESASQYLFGKAAKDRVVLLHNAIDLESFYEGKKESERVRHELLLGKGPVIGHVGRFTEQKNHGFILKIFKELRKVNNEAKLLLVGDGPLMSEIRCSACQELPEDSVCFTGSRQDVPRLMGAMDVFLFPSVYEGFPVVLLEAQAAGLPVLGSDTIDQKVDVTGGCYFMSLKEPASRWAERLCQILEQEFKADVRNLENGPYNIKKEAQKLDVFYCSTAERL